MPHTPEGTYIYHITDVANLKAIIGGGGLLSDAALIARAGAPVVGIGHSHIKQRRLTQVRIPEAGNRFVGEFVPFYYCPRSPMLYTVNQGNTGRPQGCQTEIVHLVSTVAVGIGLGRQWAISDVNAGSAYPNFFNDVRALDTALDWNAIQSKYWSSCATAKAAEFLVADSFPWTGIIGIGCHSQAVADHVTQLIGHAQHRPPVKPTPTWYY
ncbi:DUF4433 domain-containing protein [uncultured Pseudacidovorax sp.]|uniref:type II toxin-antitoxin system toxin DNA ADP-ribosyl transferase DarT n=1 Tax=uncultured Pseudacidovorax sp. TaxID=679313 RepID=UPI0025DAAFCF|nr:DUF4433 domain-containing protein [uncultured Pseudacidovorax sp.]